MIKTLIFEMSWDKCNAILLFVLFVQDHLIIYLICFLEISLRYNFNSTLKMISNSYD